MAKKKVESKQMVVKGKSMAKEVEQNEKGEQLELIDTLTEAQKPLVRKPESTTRPKIAA